jgi:hypothetical protein
MAVEIIEVWTNLLDGTRNAKQAPQVVRVHEFLRQSKQQTQYRPRLPWVGRRFHRSAPHEVTDLHVPDVRRRGLAKKYRQEVQREIQP